MINRLCPVLLNISLSWSARELMSYSAILLPQVTKDDEDRRVSQRKRLTPSLLLETPDVEYSLVISIFANVDIYIYTPVH